MKSARGEDRGSRKGRGGLTRWRLLKGELEFRCKGKGRTAIRAAERGSQEKKETVGERTSGGPVL